MMRSKLRRLAGRLQAGTVLRAAAAAAAVLLLAGGTVVHTHSVQPDGVTVRLRRGWNNVPYFGPDSRPDIALSSIAGCYTSVCHWDNLQQRYLSFDPADPSASELQQLQAGRAYWIRATEDVDIVLPAPRPGLVPALVPGLNNFVYTGPPAPVREALAILDGHYTRVHGWDAAAQRYRSASVAAAAASPNDLPALEPCGCYWLDFA